MTSDRESAQITSRQPINHAVLPFIVAATFFMEYLDTTVIATALPQMAKSFRIGPNEVSLGMTAYMLTLAVFIPVSGWISGRFGSRTVFGGAIVIFTLASVACGFSTGIVSFTLARVLQGIGGAMMVPVGRTIVVRNTEKSQLVKAISTITWPAIVAPVVGPTVGGFITTYASWHWIFFLNIPFGILTLAAACAIVPNQHDAERRGLDIRGFLLTGGALILILYGTETASRQNANLFHAALLVGTGMVFGILAVRHAKTTRHPLLDLSMLKIPTFSVTVLTGSVSRIGIETVPYLSPLLFQLGFGLSPFHSGLMLLATACGNLGMKAFTTSIYKRLTFRTVCVGNIVIAAVFVCAIGWLAPGTPLGLMLAVLFIYGLARSLQFSTLATFAYADIDDAQKAAASTLWSVAQQMTIGMGIAFGALALRLASAASQGGVSAAGYTLADFRLAFTMAGVLVLLSMAGYLRLSSDAGSNINGKAIRKQTA